jgi:hypothetical protein
VAATLKVGDSVGDRLARLHAVQRHIALQIAKDARVDAGIAVRDLSLKRVKTSSQV